MSNRFKVYSNICNVINILMENDDNGIQKYILDEKTTTHNEIVTELEKLINNQIIDGEPCTALFPPIVQNSNFNLNFDTQNDNSEFRPEVVTISVGIKLKNSCAYAAKTFLINEKSEVKESYKILHEAYALCLNSMRLDSTFGSMFQLAKDFLEFSNLSQFFICSATGSDENLPVYSSSDIPTLNMIVVLRFSLENVLYTDGSGKKFTLLISSTVNCGSEGFEYLGAIPNLSYESISFRSKDKFCVEDVDIVTRPHPMKPSDTMEKLGYFQCRRIQVQDVPILKVCSDTEFTFNCKDLILDVCLRWYIIITTIIIIIIIIITTIRPKKTKPPKIQEWEKEEYSGIDNLFQKTDDDDQPFVEDLLTDNFNASEVTVVYHYYYQYYYQYYY